MKKMKYDTPCMEIIILDKKTIIRTSSVTAPADNDVIIEENTDAW